MKNDIAKALAQAQLVQPPQNPNPNPNPLLPNQALEQQAASANPPMHPMVAAIMQHLGLLNMIRNQNNAAMVAGDQQ